MPRFEVHTKDSCPINKRLPVEILMMIFLLLGPSSFENPYIYLPLSWVCRQWRSIVLNTSVFWTVIEHRCKRTKLQSLTRDVVFRSKPREIDVAAYSVCASPQSCSNCSAKSCLYYFKHLRVRTLLLRGNHRSDFDFSYRENLTPVDNLILSRVYVKPSNQQQQFFHVNAFLSALNPRFMELSSEMLYQPTSHSLLHRLEWLKLNIPYNENFSIASYFLEALPNLRILNIIDGTHLPAARVTNLPNLRILTMNAGPYSIRTSLALSYLGISSFCSDTYNWDHVNNIDLSMTKSFRVALCCYNQYGYPQFVPHSVACISTGDSEEDCNFFNHFHASALQSNKSMDYLWTLPPPNSFHISFKWLSDHEALYSQLKQKATNLVELIVDCQSIRKSHWRDPNCLKWHLKFLDKTLSNFDKVIRLSVLHSGSLVSICSLLMDGRRLPRLERLTYYSSPKPTCNPKFVATRMGMVQRARMEAGSEPLQILQLKNYIFLPQRQVGRLKRLGIQLIQSV